MTRDEAARMFDEMATLLDLSGAEVFRATAYRNAARQLEQMSQSLEAIAAGKPVRGLGESLMAHLKVMSETGKFPELDALRATIPEGVRKMLRISGLGPKKVKALHEGLGITTLEALKAACEAGTVAKLKGFGEKTQANILAGIGFIDTVGNRVRFDQAYPLGLKLLEQLRALPGVTHSELCGSLRRRRETAKDIDILLAADDPAAVMAHFVALPEVMQVVSHGPSKSAIVARMERGGKETVLNADLRIVEAAQFPYAVVHFTGSREHNKRMRNLALEKGWTLNEYGLTGPGAPQHLKTEAEIHQALGLDYIAPELREDTGEIDAAAAHTLPKLVELKQVRGVFHNHTTYSDGSATVARMADAACEMGFEYLGLADHSQSLKVANGMSPAAVRKQWAEIDRVNESYAEEGATFRVFKGVECDILRDGSLDYDDALLSKFDYVVASVHTLFNLSRQEQTDRICKALSHPSVTMLGHATGRLLLKREGYELDLDAVLQAAAEHKKMIEINAHPVRLDLDWVHVKKAKALGIPIVINPDAHSPEELALYVYGVDVARRGWLEAAEVVNTYPLRKIEEWFGVE